MGSPVQNGEVPETSPRYPTVPQTSYGIKVFWFFFSKKNTLLSLHAWWPVPRLRYFTTVEIQKTRWKRLIALSSVPASSESRLRVP